MTKNMKLKDLKGLFEKNNINESIVKPVESTIHFKNGLEFITKNGRITGIYPRFYEMEDLLRKYLGRPESEVISINSKVLRLKQVQYLRTITTDDYTLKISRNNTVYDIDNEELFHFVVGQPADKAIGTIAYLTGEWPIYPEIDPIFPKKLPIVPRVDPIF